MVVWAASPLRSVDIEVQICCVVSEKLEVVDSDDADLQMSKIRFDWDKLRSRLGLLEVL